MEGQSEAIELLELVLRCVDKSHEGIRSLSESLPTVMRAEDRREQTLKHFADTRCLFEKILLLTRWSVQSPLAAKCAELLKTAEMFSGQLIETNNRLFYLHSDLKRARERNYDLPTAIDVLYGGTYSHLPKAISYAMQPKEMPEVDEDKAIQEMDDLIRFRLIEEDIPDAFTKIDIQGGFMTAQVKGEFEIVFTLNGKESDSLWRIVAINTVLTDPTAQETYKTLASTNTLRIIKANAPTELHYMHIRNLVQKCMNKSKHPLVAACDIMRDFCCSLSLQILVAQGQLLTDSRWKGSNVEFIYHADKQVLDICYWSTFSRPAVLSDETTRQEKEMAEKFRKEDDSCPDFPSSSLCIRLYSDAKHHDLLSVQLYPLPLAELRDTIAEAITIPRNMYGLSAEAFLMGAMRTHVASALICLERLLVIGTGVGSPVHLTTGESVVITRTERSLHIVRNDSGSLQQYYLEISFDIHAGQFTANCVAASKSSDVENVVKQLEVLLQRLCKVQLPPKGTLKTLSLTLDDSTQKNVQGLIQQAISDCLREILAYEIAEVASTFTNVEVHRHIPIYWDRYVNYRKQQGISTEISISPSCLFLQIFRNKESSGYLVVEFDKQAEYEKNTEIHSIENEEDWIRTPVFTVLQLSTSGIRNSVHCYQQLPAIRKDDPSITMLPPSKKLKTNAGNSGSTPPLAPLISHMISLFYERIQIQLYGNFAKRRRVRIRYTGQGGSEDDQHPTGQQIVTFPFPERVSSLSTYIRTVHGHLSRNGGFEMCVQLTSQPFTFLVPNDFKTHYNHGRNYALPNGNLIFVYPSSAKIQPDSPLETFINEFANIKPMFDLGAKLEKTLKSLGRYGPNEDVRDHFFAERADPFSITLACRTNNPKRCVAAGSTRDDLITYRVTIHYKHKGGYILTNSHRGEHPLMPYIQVALNAHHDSAQLLEALERTTIPLAILSSVVSSKVISAKCYRHEAPAETENSSFNGKKGGGKFRLGYKGKLPGEENGYYAEKSYGGDDKSFVPADLTLIPRSQNHIRLVYADRCGIDVIFMENEMVTIKNAPCGARVPSCSVEGGLSVSHAAFGEKLRSVILPEMASL